MRWATDADLEEARAAGQVIAEHGDVLQFGGRVGKGQEGAGAIAAKLARALAVLAYQPGGVSAFGRRWTA